MAFRRDPGPDRAWPRAWRWLGAGVGLLGAGIPATLHEPRDFTAPFDVAAVERVRYDVAPRVEPMLRAEPTRHAPIVAPAAANPWAGLLARAAAEDPVPACRLAVLLEDCRLARQVEHMIDTEVSMAAREGRAAEHAADDILALQASGAGAQAACGAAPPELLAQEWHYLLRAALAGHAPSMHRFVTDLPLDAASPEERAAALAAWRRHAPELLATLVQRRSRDALVLAYRASQGFAILGDQPLQRRDPIAAARLGRALEIVHDDDPALAVELAALQAELDPARLRHAQREGERLADAFLANDPAVATADLDDCDTGWPGMPATWTAYGHQPVE